MKNSIRVLIIITILFPLSNISAQERTLYLMKGIHQSHLTNPAVQSGCKWYLELPVLSSIKTEAGNNNYTFDNIFIPGTGEQADSLVIDLDYIEDKIHKNNYFRECTDINLLGFGFAISDMYFTIGLSTKTFASFSFPDDLVNVKNGNWDAETNSPIDLDFSDMRINATAYNELSIGFSKPASNRLTIGGKAKVLFGMANFNTRTSGIVVESVADQTDQYVETMSVNADIQMNIAFPLKVVLDEDGFIDSLEVEDIKAEDLLSFDNKGFAVDLGVTYEVNDNITIFGSIIDLGLINWKSNLNNISTSGETFDFKGIEITPDDDEDEDFEEQLEDLGDSIKNVIKITKSEDSYTTGLNTKIYLGGEYLLSDIIGFGALTRFEFFDKRLHPSLTLSSNIRPTKWFSTSITYTAMSNSYANIGLGLFIKGGPLQFYMINDNLFGVFAPKKFKYPFATRFGLNLVFGKREDFKHSLIEDI